MTDENELLRRVQDALKAVKHPTTGVDLVTAGRIQDLSVVGTDAIHFQFLLRPEDPGTLVKEARQAVEGLSGVSRVKVDVKLPQADGAGASAGGGGGAGAAGGAAGGHSHGGPRKGGGLQPGSVPAPTPQADLRAGMQHVIAVSSGKGGVGKSTVAANLAAALAAEGKSVGLLDADIYGPDIPLLFAVRERPKVTGDKGREKIVPLEAHGVKLMSLGFLLEEEQPAIMRGPLVAGILKQFLEQVEWGKLDYLVVDMPPGTGDAQLSLVQTIELDGALMVTTPQEVSTSDVRRAIRMFERVNTRVLGVVENMSGYECPDCGHHADIFGAGGGARLAEDMQIPLVATVPLDMAVREAGDRGAPTALSAADSPAGRAFREVAQSVVERLEGALASTR